MANIGCDELEYSSWQRSVLPCSKVEEASYMCRGVMSRRPAHLGMLSRRA